MLLPCRKVRQKFSVMYITFTISIASQKEVFYLLLQSPEALEKELAEAYKRWEEFEAATGDFFCSDRFAPVRQMRRIAILPIFVAKSCNYATRHEK